MRPSSILLSLQVVCALAVTPCVAQAQPAGKLPVVASTAYLPARETGKDTRTPTLVAARLEDYAGIYEFPIIRR